MNTGVAQDEGHLEGGAVHTLGRKMRITNYFERYSKSDCFVVFYYLVF